MGTVFIDMAGRVCGRLTVLTQAPNRGAKVMWRCHCACGSETVVEAAKLRSGHTRSCGCLKLTKGIATLDRFLAKVTPGDGGCWIWTGGLNGVGYGQFYEGKNQPGDTGKTYAHRWSYEYHIGPVPAGLHLDHLCRNRACVNPWHLEPVTIRVNLLRGEGPSAKNAAKTHCPAGHPLSGENVSAGAKGERRCRECGRIQSRKQYWKNPEKHREYARAYKARAAV